MTLDKKFVHGLNSIYRIIGEHGKASFDIATVGALHILACCRDEPLVHSSRRRWPAIETRDGAADTRDSGVEVPAAERSGDEALAKLVSVAGTGCPLPLALVRSRAISVAQNGGHDADGARTHVEGGARRRCRLSASCATSGTLCKDAIASFSSTTQQLHQDATASFSSTTQQLQQGASTQWPPACCADAVARCRFQGCGLGDRLRDRCRLRTALHANDLSRGATQMCSGLEPVHMASQAGLLFRHGYLQPLAWLSPVLVCRDHHALLSSPRDAAPCLLLRAAVGVYSFSVPAIALACSTSDHNSLLSSGRSRWALRARPSLA